ncbi:MAG: radical SAM family heme chaperone HemW [Fuerstiella sp.]
MSDMPADIDPPEPARPDVYAAPKNPAQTPRAVYIHVPFCLHRCGYCDFTLVADRDDLVPSYLQALEHELNQLDRTYDVDTIFIGGGTPTHLTVTQLQQLAETVRRRFRLSDGGEFSIEANPDGLDDDRLSALADAGVNRLSLGVQSFDDPVLQTLERQHTAAEAIEVVERAMAWFRNVSVDLIFGVPGQTIAVWQHSLAAAAQLPLSHISTYGLTFEKGTDFFRRRQHGQLNSVPDEIEREMYDLALTYLPTAGLQHYEISNFARPGLECRHNMVYWEAREYFAFGPGAARYVNGIRSTNSRNVSRWVSSWLKHTPALQEHEILDNEARAREAIFLALRQVRGLRLDEFETRFATSIQQLAGDSLQYHLTSGNLVIEEGCLRLTTSGRFVADTVVADFL